MTERVRVTGPARRRTAASSRASAIDTDSRLGGIYMGSLLREQGWLAVRVLGALAVMLGSLPLVFHLWPSLSNLSVAGVPVSWILLGVTGYPLLFGLGWWYVRRAERNEDSFAELMREAGPAEDEG